MTWQSKNKLYVYLIKTKAVHSSAFPALFCWYCEPFLIRSTTWIRWRPGICGLQARVCIHQPPCSQDCEKLGSILGARLRIQLINLMDGWVQDYHLTGEWNIHGVSKYLNAPTQAWWSWSVTSWSRSFTLCGRSVTLWIEVGQEMVICLQPSGVWQAGCRDGRSEDFYTFQLNLCPHATHKGNGHLCALHINGHAFP